MTQTFSFRIRLKVAQLRTEFWTVRSAFLKLRHKNTPFAARHSLEVVCNNIRSIHVRIATWKFHIYRWIERLCTYLFVVYL